MSEGKHDVKTHQKAEEPKPKKKRSPLKILLILIVVIKDLVIHIVIPPVKKMNESRKKYRLMIDIRYLRKFLQVNTMLLGIVKIEVAFRHSGA